MQSINNEHRMATLRDDDEEKDGTLVYNYKMVNTVYHLRKPHTVSSILDAHFILIVNFSSVMLLTICMDYGSCLINPQSQQFMTITKMRRCLTLEKSED